MAKVPDFDDPISKDQVSPGTHVETYAIAPPSLSRADDREPGVGWVADWRDDKKKVLVEYGAYMDNLWVPREKVRRGDPERDLEHSNRGPTPTFP